MDALNLLEQKIATLIESKKQDLAIIKESKSLVLQLQEENARLKDQLEKLENSLLVRHQSEVEELQHERVLTKMVLDDLIKSIDLLVEQDPQQAAG
jgi:dynactin complex subunit